MTVFTSFVVFCILFTELIGAEGARSSKMLRIFFVRCLLEEAYSMSCGSSGTGETPQTRSVEEAHRPLLGKRVACSENQGSTLIGGNNNQKEPFVEEFNAKFKIIFTFKGSDNTIKKEWKNIPNTIKRRRGK